jgi:hypothetical protein
MPGSATELNYQLASLVQAAVTKHLSEESKQATPESKLDEPGTTLQDAIRHTEEVLKHIQVTRHKAILSGGLLHPEQIVAMIVRPLIPEMVRILRVIRNDKEP